MQIWLMVVFYFLPFNDFQNREDQANYVYFVQAYVVSSFGRNNDNLPM